MIQENKMPHQIVKVHSLVDGLPYLIIQELKFEFRYFKRKWVLNLGLRNVKGEILNFFHHPVCGKLTLFIPPSFIRGLYYEGMGMMIMTEVIVGDKKQ